jgi:hypothetical protein
MDRYLVHGDGFAEIEHADSPAQAIRQFRIMAQHVNPDINMQTVSLVAERADARDEDDWRHEFIAQHRMTFGLTDEFD